jgi:uncharacterized membrane protein YheB (UPF0754 family)
MNGHIVYLVLFPLIASFLAYWHTWVAIWMLFRPLTEKRIFGIKVPFTPGLIPSRRLEMAQRMGKAVANRLVTQETVAARIATPEVRTKVEEIIDAYLKQLMARELGGIRSLIPDRLRPDWEEFLNSLQGRIESWLADLLRNTQTEAFIRKAVQAQAERLLRAPLREILPAEWLARLPDQLAALLGRLIEDPDFEYRLRTYLETQIDHALASEKPLGDYLPETLRQTVYAKLNESLPILLEKLAGVLEDEQIKRQIKIQVYDLIDRVITQTFDEGSLWDRVKFGLLETFVISTDEIKEKVDRGIDEAAPRITQLLQQEEMRNRVFRALIEAIETLLAKSPADWQLSTETRAQLKARLGDAVVSASRSPHLKEQLTQMVRDQMANYQQRSLIEIFPTLQTPEISRQIADYLLRLLQTPETHATLVRFITQQLQGLLDRPIGRLSDQIPERYWQQARAWLADQTLEILKRETPRMVGAINIEKLVTEQIGSFSLQEMERLVFAVTGQQLKAITWFGAWLGMLIGILQDVLILTGVLSF